MGTLRFQVDFITHYTSVTLNYNRLYYVTRVPYLILIYIMYIFLHRPQDRYIGYLPLAHIMELACGKYF